MEYFGEIPSSLKGSTVLIPAISTGWIAQATLDLIIKTYNIPRVGFFEDESILPAVCAFAENRMVVTALELFHDAKLNLTIIQHRSAPATGHSLQFISRLMGWVREQHFGRVLIVSTSNVAFRSPVQVSSSEPLGKRFISEPSLTATENEILAKNGWVELEQWKDEKKLLPGSGNTWTLFQSAAGFSIPQVETLLHIELEKARAETGGGLRGPAGKISLDYPDEPEDLPLPPGFRRMPHPRRRRARASGGGAAAAEEGKEKKEKKDEDEDEEEEEEDRRFPLHPSSSSASASASASSSSSSASASASAAPHRVENMVEMQEALLAKPKVDVSKPDNAPLPVSVLVAFASDTISYAVADCTKYAETLRPLLKLDASVQWAPLPEWEESTLDLNEEDLYG